ncbi:MAG: hypothetical protein K6L76_06540 [Agarilytica sp.]
MAKKNQWHNLWGPIKVLNNEDDVQINNFSSSRLKDLENCTSIYSLVLSKSLDRVDLSCLSHLVDLEHLTLDRVDFHNEQALLNLPKLNILELEEVSLSKDQQMFFDNFNEEFISKNYELTLKRFKDAQTRFHGKAWPIFTEEEAKENNLAANKVKSSILNKDWEKAYSSEIYILEAALKSLFHSHIEDESVVSELVECKDDEIFNLIVKTGLNSHYSYVADMFISSISKQSHRLCKPLERSFVYYLNLPWRYGEFSVGKLKTAHFSIVKILNEVAGRDFESLYRLFLNERFNFSDLHLTAYKRLLDIAHKCCGPSLAVEIIDLIRFENYIPDGDSAYIKKCIRAASKVGGSEHLTSMLELMRSENREDVLKEYKAAEKRFKKKSVKA